jgi:hypothetical protein
MKIVSAPEGFLFYRAFILDKRIIYVIRKNWSGSGYYELAFFDPLYEKIISPITKFHTESVHNNVGFGVYDGKFIFYEDKNYPTTTAIYPETPEKEFHFQIRKNLIIPYVTLYNLSIYCPNKRLFAYLYRISMYDVKWFYICDSDIYHMVSTISEKYNPNEHDIILYQPEYNSEPRIFSLKYQYDNIFLDPTEPVIIANSTDRTKLTVIDLEI